MVKDLKTFVPGSEGTQLYLLAATHEPFRNNHFGLPPVVERSLERTDDLEMLGKIHSAYRWPITRKSLHQLKQLSD